jgi:predicted kinase
VLIDASFKEDRRRLEFLDAARDWGVPVRFMVCESPADVVHERLARREGDPSDADWTIYEHVRRTWDPPGERSAAVSTIVDTSGPPDSTLAAARAQLARAGLGRGAP